MGQSSGLVHETSEQLGLKMDIRRIGIEQIRLYRETFKGRQDVVPRYRQSKKGHNG